MSGSLGLTVSFDEDDFAALVSGGLVIEEKDEHNELQRLSRRISGQHVDVLAAFAAAAFHGSQTSLVQIEGVLSALVRLADASEDRALSRSLQALETLLPGIAAVGGNRRRDFMRGLSEWVLDFSSLLEPADADRLRRLVSFEGERLPLLDRLSNVRGIGPKRLQRLYSAGLFSVEAVAHAEAEDVAAVTGLPLALAGRVVQAAVDFAREERLNLINDLRRRSSQLGRALEELEGDDEARRRVIEAALEAMNQIREALLVAGARAEEE